MDVNEGSIGVLKTPGYTAVAAAAAAAAAAANRNKATAPLVSRRMVRRGV